MDRSLKCLAKFVIKCFIALDTSVVNVIAFLDSILNCSLLMYKNRTCLSVDLVSLYILTGFFGGVGLQGFLHQDHAIYKENFTFFFFF